MSITDISTMGWEAFWASATSAGSLGLMFAFAIVCLLAGFALNSVNRAAGFIMRGISALLAIFLVMGFLSNAGITSSTLAPIVNWFLEIVHAPVLLSES